MECRVIRSLVFVIGLILLGRNITNGDFNPNRKRTWLEYFQQKGQPIASSCGGGGTCGLCKVTLQGNSIPSPTAAEKALLSATELEAGRAYRVSTEHHPTMTLSCIMPESMI